MLTAERTQADTLQPPRRALPKTKRLADAESVQAPEKRRLPLLTAISIDRGA